MIVKYVYNSNVTCTYYDNERAFLKECRKSEFEDIFYTAKDVIVLENSGYHYACNSLLEVYHRYNNYLVKEK